MGCGRPDQDQRPREFWYSDAPIHWTGQGTRPEAAKIPMLAVTSTEVIEAMHHCMPNESYP
jgi:hypothetical protein